MSDLRSVAARAGVSIATASRALSGHPRVDPATRVKVRAAAEEIGYRPSAAAQALKKNHTMLVGLLVPGVTSSLYAEVCTKIQALLGARGYQVILCLHQEDPAREREYLLRLGSYQVAAIVHVPTGTKSARAIYAEADVPAPYVVELNRHSDDGTTDAVCCRDSEGVYELTSLLIGAGHTRVGLITAEPRESTARERLTGFTAALHDHGLPYDPELVVAGEYTEAWGAQGLRQLIGLDHPATAVITPANMLVLGALRAIAELDLRIPDDLSIVTFADFPWHSVHRPPLTSMQRPHDQMAEEACDLIIAHQATNEGNRDPVTIRVAAQLSERASVKRL